MVANMAPVRAYFEFVQRIFPDNCSDGDPWRDPQTTQKPGQSTLYRKNKKVRRWHQKWDDDTRSETMTSEVRRWHQKWRAGWQEENLHHRWNELKVSCLDANDVIKGGHVFTFFSITMADYFLAKGTWTPLIGTCWKCLIHSCILAQRPKMGWQKNQKIAKKQTQALMG